MKTACPAKKRADNLPKQVIDCLTHMDDVEIGKLAASLLIMSGMSAVSVSSLARGLGAANVALLLNHLGPVKPQKVPNQ